MVSENEGTLAKAHTIPEFASEDEERAWWACHDTSELPGQDIELHYVEPGDREVARVVSVQVDQGTLRRLEELAAGKGLSYRAMVRSWILERLREEGSPSAGSS